MTVSLTYRLGEIPLCSRTFTGVANRQHFTTVEAYSQFPDPTADLVDQPDFVFYPTYPVAFVPEPLVSRGSWIVYTPYTFKNYYIDLERVGTFDAYLKRFSSKSRATLQRKIKKYAEANNGQATWRKFTRAEEMEEFFSLAREVSRKTYQERLLGIGLPDTPEFLVRAKALAASRGVLGYILLLNGRVVAYMFCSCANGIATYDYLGYDPTFQSLSPGTVLQYLILQSMFEEKEIRIFDFTEGEGEQKRFFGTDERLCAKTYFFRRTLRNIVLVKLHYGLNRFVELVGNLLDRCGLKQTIRRFIRRVV